MANVGAQRPNVASDARRWRNRITGHGEVDAKTLLANPKNWRIHPKNQVDALAGVLSEVGWVQDVIVNKRSGFVVDGHARVALAIKAEEKVPVVYVDLDEREEAIILATIDPLSAMAEKDEKLLAELVGDLVVGDDALKALVLDLAGKKVVAGLTDPDAVPELPPEPTTVPGDLWILGPHRLLCGDSTQIDAVDLLMDGGKADPVFTDPPYNVDYEGYTEEKLKIKGDKMAPEKFSQFLTDVFVAYFTIIKAEASLYVCHASSCQREFQNAIEAAGLEVRCQIIWAKNTFAWGFGRYKFQHEPIFYCHVAGISDPWYGDKSQSTLWQENKPAANRLHPTMKPVELIARALVNSSKPGDIVCDLFGGSGSTLIACEKDQRVARLMEVDPKYCDVIVRRWQEFTGKDAVLDGVGGGRTFRELAAERVPNQTPAAAVADAE